MSYGSDAEYTAEAGELCPSCNEYLLDGDSGDVVECPNCGATVVLD